MADSIINSFNIYCDESRVENKDSEIMVIGALIIPRNEKRNIFKKLNQIFIRRHFNQELKWNKVGKKYIDFYKEVINYFINNKSLQFRCIVVDKTKIKYSEFHENDTELAFFKFYYLMLRKRLSDQNNYYIFLDKKQTRDKNRARALKLFLDSYILINNKNCNIKHLQSYQSHENKFIQLADFFTGLMSFACNSNSSKNKLAVVKYLSEELKREDISQGTSLLESKFNVFVWKSKL